MSRLLLVAALALPMVAAPEVAAAMDPRVRDGIARVENALDAWDLVKARAALDELLAVDATSGPARLTTARVRFEEGDYAGAVEIYDELGVKGGWSDLARATWKEFRNYEQRESEHFIFRYPPGKDAILAPYALEALEKQYRALKEDLGYAPPGKVLVEVVHDAAALSRVSTLSLEAIKTSGTIAICKFNRLMITSPKATVYGYGWIDTLAHEYVHLVVSKMSDNTVPIWIHEGLAKYLESRWRGKPGLALTPSSAGLLHEAVKQKKLIPFEKMHPSMALLPSQEDAALAFAEVFTAIEYMHQKGGNALLRKLIDTLRMGRSHQAAVSAVMGVPFSRFESDWKAYLARREYPRDAIALSTERLRFKEDAPQEAAADAKKDKEELRFGDFQEIDDVEARKMAHLGELLRVRGRNRAAVEEFEKAHKRVGARSRHLSNKYAQALMETGAKEKAEQVLLASARAYPGWAATHLKLGELYLASGRTEDATTHFLEAVAQNPFDPRPHAALHSIYQGQNRKAEAERQRNVLRLLSGEDVPVMSGNAVLVVRSHPFAKVIVDGVDRGVTTPARIEVSPGRHEVVLRNEERGFERQQTIEVGAGEEKVVEIVLESDEQ